MDNAPFRVGCDAGAIRRFTASCRHSPATGKTSLEQPPPDARSMVVLLLVDELIELGIGVLFSPH